MARRSSGGGGFLMGLRLRRLISFLRRNHLLATAHAVERQSGVFFDAAHLRRMLLADRWAAASSYTLRFVTLGNLSPEADNLIFRILIVRVMAAFDAGQAQSRSVDSLFQRIYMSLEGYKERDTVRKLLLSMRYDRTKSSILYRRVKPLAMKIIMDSVAKCPELQAKARLPRCTFDPAYIMSLGGPGSSQCRSHNKNKAARIPARDLARCFLQKRPLHHIGNKMHHPGISRCHSESQPGNSKELCD